MSDRKDPGWQRVLIRLKSPNYQNQVWSVLRSREVLIDREYPYQHCLAVFVPSNSVFARLRLSLESWAEVQAPRYVGLARDGVINEDSGTHVVRWHQFRFIDGVLDELGSWGERSIEVIILSNQQGVGLGEMHARDLDFINQRMMRAMAEAGGLVARTYYCPHSEKEKCACRKPKIGLFQKAQADLCLPDLERVHYLGDSPRDVIAGRAAGMPTVLVTTGKTTAKEARKWKKDKPDHICASLKEAGKVIF